MELSSCYFMDVPYPKCQGRMRILAFIEDVYVIRLPRLLSASNGMSGGVSRNYAECWNLLGDGNGGQVKKILKRLGQWERKARCLLCCSHFYLDPQGESLYNFSLKNKFLSPRPLAPVTKSLDASEPSYCQYNFQASLDCGGKM